MYFVAREVKVNVLPELICIRSIRLKQTIERVGRSKLVCKPNYPGLWGIHVNARQIRFLFLFLNIDTDLKVQLKKSSPTFDKFNEM